MSFFSQQQSEASAASPMRTNGNVNGDAGSMDSLDIVQVRPSSGCMQSYIYFFFFFFFLHNEKVTQFFVELISRDHLQG